MSRSLATFHKQLWPGLLLQLYCILFHPLSSALFVWFHSIVHFAGWLEVGTYRKYTPVMMTILLKTIFYGSVVHFGTHTHTHDGPTDAHRNKLANAHSHALSTLEIKSILPRARNKFHWPIKIRHFVNYTEEEKYCYSH